jgi:hypothetical protein
MFLFEERICQNGQMSVSATVDRMQERTQRAFNDRLACGGGEFRDDLNAPSLERYFPLERYLRGRNAPYSLNDQGNPLKSQKMRPHAMPEGKSLKLRRFFPKVTAKSYYSVLA